MEVAVEGGLLVRVFAVAQVLQFDKATIGLCRKQLTGGGCILGGHALAQVDGRQVIADGGIVVADAVEGGHSQGKAGRITDGTCGFEISNDLGVLAGIGQYRHVFPVFGGAAHHGGATDVDVFDGIGQATPGLGDGGFKRVEVDHQEVDGLYAIRRQCAHVQRAVAPCQQAAMYFGVQGFDAPIEHFRKARHLSHFGHRQTCIHQQFGGSACGNQFNSEGVEVTRQF